MSVIMWKDEDEVEGIPTGPTWLCDDRGVIQEYLGWHLKPNAMKMAEEAGYEFEEA